MQSEEEHGSARKISLSDKAFYWASEYRSRNRTAMRGTYEMSSERRRNEPVCADRKESRKYSDMGPGYVAAISGCLHILLVHVPSYIIGNETRPVTRYALCNRALMRACMFPRRFVAQIFAHVPCGM